MAMRTQIVWPRYSHLTDGGENWLGAQFHVMSPLTTSTSHAALIGRWFGKLQQPGERRRSRLVHGGANGRLHRFRIGAPAAVAFGEDTSEQRGYFPRDLGLDRLCRFFSSGVNASSTGRSAQIFSLISTISPQSS